jgi:carbon monoxide dehydrogenase subunit G
MMKVSGSATLNAPREQVWSALNDPNVLVRTIPGCQRLEAIDTDAYRMTVTAGVASIKGVYTGEVRLTDQQPPDKFLLRAAGSGGPGTVSADVWVVLAEDGADGASSSTTTLTYDADAVVGGMIGGVGQRMLTGVAKKTAGEFFAAVNDVLTGKTAAGVVSPSEQTSAADGSATRSASQVFEAPGAAQALAASGSTGSFVQGALVGAGVALFGALVGGWLSGRRRNP